MFWVNAAWNRDRNVVSTAPSAELGLRLYQATGERAYFDAAMRMYDWTYRTLLDTDSGGDGVDGLFWDHITLSGDIDKTQWSYNQGTMIGANVLLYAVTQDALYLDRARALADTALGYYGRVGYRTQAPAFNAVFFRNLLLMASVDAAYLLRTRDAMQSYADDIWLTSRGVMGLFTFPSDTAIS